MLCEMQWVSSRVWTRIAVSISCDDNHYTTGYWLWEIYLSIPARYHKFDTATRKDKCIMYRQRMSIVINEICINEVITHTHTHTHIYIYIYIYIYICSPTPVRLSSHKARLFLWIEFSVAIKRTKQMWYISV